ncbi:MAG TPA: sulfite exporter TauE/SafE family protein [Burkholderiales bacterium]|nr:sulfite exporter TauE/SafE family protein [Burkholderiales bacterium]
MDGLSSLELVFCAAVVTTAFAVRGGTGFGASTVAIPFLAFAVPLQLAVPVISALIIGNSVSLIAREWNRIAWRAVLVTVPYTAIGVGIGLYALTNLDDQSLLRGMGVIVALYGISGLVLRQGVHAVSPRYRPVLAATTGMAGGSVGALFGAGVGPIYAMYMRALDMDKNVFRVTVTSAILFQLLARVGGYASLGYYGGGVLLVLIAAVPFMLLGSWLGDVALRRMDQQLFGRVVSGVLVASGSALLLK